MSSGRLETVRTEDFIEYYLFPHPESIGNDENTDLLASLQTFINDFAGSYCSTYIWHKDPFRVTPRYEKSNLLVDNTCDKDTNDELPPHLYGITHFSDNIQDEWFIVSLLFELSKQIVGLVIRCCDSDGEFLLIEAADHLPKWANPDSCTEKAFIFNGHLHLLNTAETNSNLSLSEAVHLIRTNPTKHQVSNEIEGCIVDRTKGYPESISSDQHVATVYIPIAAAILLKQNPQLIATAVRSFCARDQIDMKACRAMKHFPPENRVYTRVTFSKCLYAMLNHSQFQPDRRIGWNLPPTTDPKYKAHLLGVKLACGFEILTAQAKPVENIQDSRNWLEYYESLKNRGYFRNYLEHSQNYVRLLNVATEYFQQNVASSIPQAQEIGHSILTILKTIDCNADEFNGNESTLTFEDDDSWMNISPDDLDAMLQKRYGIKKTFSSINDNADASEFSGNIKEFLDKKSDFTGIETDADSIRPVRPKRGIKKTKNNVQFHDLSESGSGTDSPITGAGGDANKIDFNPEAFQNHVQDMLNLVIPEDNWESNSDMSDFSDDDGFDKNINEMNGPALGNRIKTSLESYMEQMDRELSQTTIGKSFEKRQNTSTTSANDDFDDIEEFTPVDIDVNTLKNMVQTYQHQLGGPGPASTLLNSMGIRLNPSSCIDDLSVPNNTTV